MKSKLERQRLIKQIIKEQKVASQEELSALLEKNGMCVAQATLSRDIREMRIAKLHGEEGYYYHLAQSDFPRATLSNASISDSVESLEFSGQLAVIKTRPGHAMMVAAVIDDSELKPIMGTIAGDDTILLLVREGVSHDDVFKALTSVFKGLEYKRLN